MQNSEQKRAQYEKKAQKTQTSRRDKFRPEMYVQAYILARAGTSTKGIAAALGIDMWTYKMWKIAYPALHEGVIRGRQDRPGAEKAETFIDYIYGRLPDDVQAVWDKINIFKDDYHHKKMVDTIMGAQPKRVRQYLFVHAWVTGGFSRSKALASLGLTNQVFDNWCKDPDFKKLVIAIKDYRGDFYEDALMNLVRAGNPAAIIFANRTFNAKRGYNPKVEVSIKGEITHGVVDLNALGLSLEDRIKILQKLREQKGEGEKLLEHKEVDFDKLSDGAKEIAGKIQVKVIPNGDGHKETEK